MKFGLAVSTFPTAFGPIMLSGDLPRRLPEIAALGYQGIDLFIRRADEPGLEDVERAVRRAGLQVAIVAAVGASHALDFDRLMARFRGFGGQDPVLRDWEKLKCDRRSPASSATTMSLPAQPSRP